MIFLTLWERNQVLLVLSVQKVFSGSGRVGRLRLVGKYIDHRLVRPEPVNTFWTDNTPVFFLPIVRQKPGDFDGQSLCLTAVFYIKLSALPFCWKLQHNSYAITSYFLLHLNQTAWNIFLKL